MVTVFSDTRVCASGRGAAADPLGALCGLLSMPILLQGQHSKPSQEEDWQDSNQSEHTTAGLSSWMTILMHAGSALGLLLKN